MRIQRQEVNKGLFNKNRYIYTLSNDNVQVKIMNYGGVILSIIVPDKNGDKKDIVLGYEDLNFYKKTFSFPGAIIGRCANRIANGKMIINGVEYSLVKNAGSDHIHGGKKCFAKVLWDSKICTDDEGEYLELSYFSRDGEENYPGNLNVVVTYRLTNKNELVIKYYGKCDKDTVLNLTNHSYFNLAGQGSGNILNQKIKINSDEITAINEDGIVSGEIRNIKGTPMDFSEYKEIGKDINSDYDQIIYGKGYDHNYVVRGNDGEMKLVAEAIDELSGRKLEVFSTMPGVQFYSGNHLSKYEIGKGEVPYNKYYGFCFETQYYPDSINKENFPSPILKAGEEYNHTTIYKFSTV